MKRFLSFLFVAVLVVFTACQKEEIEEVPGNVPGMGDAVGDLEVDPYNFHEDFEFIGEIGGFEEGSVAVQGDASLKSISINESVQNSCNYGSGGRWVKVKMEVKNTNPSYKRGLYFPRGCIFKVNLEDYQHAILLDWAWACIQPGATRTIILHLYCINKGKNGSDAHSNFDIIGITKSRTMWKLLRKLAWRKINWEHYHTNYEISKNSLKASGEGDTAYEEITGVLQECVWAITNGSGLTEEQEQFIESLPMLEEGTYPKELDDKTIEPPYWFDEYSAE